MAAKDDNINRSETVVVWDIGVRLFHWLLVLTIAVAAYTGFFGRKSQIDFHVIAGVSAAALVAFRLIWGVWGTTYARFSSFIAPPGKTLRHARHIIGSRGHVTMGHNPLGGWMIVVLLALVAAVAITGTVTLGGVVKEGPLAPFVSFATGFGIREVHYYLALVLAISVGVHILGAVFESLRIRENLMRSMVTGCKQARPDAETAPTRSARPIVALGATVILAAITIPAVMHFSALPVPGVPTEPMNATYAKECGACHVPHHPSVAPAATWKAIFANLQDHFGENASLTPELTDKLRAYALANSSEKWDTRVANVMRRPSKEHPLRITDAPIWKRIHSHFPDKLFKSKAIGGKLNCTNCHRDAETGLFAPRNISIKRENKK
ncbi:MAG: cytochrome b/b6 domain-containing protein [Alphaproteobacteria bacterium]